MAKQAPNSVDIQEFQFKLHCQLKIFNNQDAAFFAKPTNLLACASQYGLIFIGTNASAFQVITINSLEKYTGSGYNERIIPLPSCPTHLAVNCDGTKLAVVTTQEGSALVLFYDVTSFTKQDVHIIKQLRLSITPNVNVLEISWNPTIANIFTACKDDGTLGVYELKENSVDINELPVGAQATCMSWSPKGKQLAVGSRNGKITQYKPDLKAMKVINAPPLEGNQHVVALHWISNYQFIAIFKPPDPDSIANLLVIDAPKTGNTVFTNYEDICYGYGSVRPPQFYTIFQPIWNLLMVASSNSVEVGVMGCQGEQWTQWILSDTARAELPLTRSKQESLPVGFALDTATTEPVIWGESSLPAAPFLLMLSHEGLLCCFRVMNMKADAQNICHRPALLTDNTGLNQFVLCSPPEPKETHFVAPTVQPIKPIATQSASFIKQPVVAETIIKPSSPVHPTPFTIQTVQTVTETLPLVMSPITSVSPLQLNETNTIQKEADILIANLIREECETLETELKSILRKASLLKIDLGTDAEAVELVHETDTLHDFLSELIETNTAQSTEIYALKQALIQTWAWYEDARFRLAQTRDTTLEALLRLQQLDPVSQRYLADIKQMVYYLDSQIKQAGQVLDEQWSDFQDKCKKIVRTKVPTLETIYQAMVRHSIVLEKQKYILKDIANRNRALRCRLSGPPILMCLNSADLLEKSLKRLQLEPEQHFLQAKYEMVLQKQKCFTQTKINKLVTLLKHRDITNVKINKPQLSNVTANLQTLLQSSPRVKTNTEASLIGAGLSPITTKSSTLWSSTFVRSTPKTTADITVVHRNVPAVSEQNMLPMGLPTTREQSQSKFAFTPPQSNMTSAFVPTTQLSFSFTNKSISSTTPTTTLSSSTFTFGSDHLIGTIDSTRTITTPKISTFSIPTTKKDLFSSKQDLFGAIVTTGAVTQSVFSYSAPDSSTTTSSASKNTLPSTFSFNLNTASTDLGLKNTVPTAFTSKTNTTNTTFVTKGTESSSVFNFAPTITTSTTSLFTSTKTTPNWFVKTTDSSVVNSAGLNVVAPTSVSLSNIPANVSIVSMNSKTNDVTPSNASLESNLNVFSKTLTNTPVTSSTSQTSLFSSNVVTTTAAATFSTSIFSTTSTATAGSASFLPAKTNASFSTDVNSTFSASLATTSMSSGPSTNIPIGIFSNINSSSGSIFSASSITPTTSSLSARTESKPVFGATTNTSSWLTTTTTGSLFSSIVDTKTTTGFNTTPTTSIFLSTTSTPLTQTSIFHPKPAPTIETSPTSTVSTSAAIVTTALGGTDTAEKKSVFGNTLGTKSNILTTAVISSSSSTNTAVLASTTSNLFNPVSTAAGHLFAATSTPSNVQNAVEVSPTTGSTTLLNFGTALSAPSSIQSSFGTSTKPLGSLPIFGSAFGPTTTTSNFSFGTSITTNSSLFSTGTTASGSIFGNSMTTTSLFSTPVTSSITSSIFGTQPSQSGSVFGSSTSTTGSIFGSTKNTSPSVFDTATTTVAPLFGSSPFTNTSSSVFGSASTTTPFGTSPPGSIFGQQPGFGTSAFGTSTNTFGSGNSAFGTESAGNANIASPQTGFAKPFSFTLPPATTSSAAFGFGDLNMGANNSPFSGQASNPFSKPFVQEPKPFGGGSLFGTPSTSSPIFGSNTSPSFGFGSSSVFPSTFGQQSSFTQQNSFGSSAQSGPFSGGNQSVSQTGFGGFSQQAQQSGFGAAPVFGSSPSGFGSPPSFGGSAFNSSFGSTNNSPTAAFAASPQQNPTFANLATQNTIGFGALAQQSQQPQPQPNQSGFSGGSSFSTWR